MIALLQRVTRARVTVAGEEVAAIGKGILALVCAERGDGIEEADALAGKVLRLRLFSDRDGKMNEDLVTARGQLLAVPQFTLAADTRSGNRPSFTPAAPPDEGRRLFERFLSTARSTVPEAQAGVFGADMQVELVNDGPVTFWLRMTPSA